MQFHHHGYVSGDPRRSPAAGVGLDRPEQIGEIPSTFNGYIWVEDIWTVGPAYRSHRDFRTEAQVKAAEAALQRRRKRE